MSSSRRRQSTRPGTLMQRLRALAPSRHQLEAHPALRRLAPRLGDPKLWHWSRRGVARSAALGLFIGVAIPVAQILFAALAALALRVNLPVAAAGTLVTNPLTVPPLYYAAYHLGAWVTGTPELPGLSWANPGALWEQFGLIASPLFIGLAILASLGAVICHALISQTWAWQVLLRRRAGRSRAIHA